MSTAGGAQRRALQAQTTRDLLCQGGGDAGGAALLAALAGVEPERAAGRRGGGPAGDGGALAQPLAAETQPGAERVQRPGSGASGQGQRHVHSWDQRRGLQ